ncbi:winged helix-turn helix protein [Larkinella arboricola]|uniref:Winged helix-turn helix protein n=1 Tax=Larkinella arboricola TaxID=643671 RepID=A0A327XA22_LARAB|nr:helix-turn-helix domain-containing protein [Larkinella arboricola]RAK00527.1 winged helix-turn helix protein [Larkinella arboricola]
MRAIKNLSPEEIKQLRYFAFQQGSSVLQKRCQCILYSYYGLSARELMDLFNVDRRSIYNWMDRWEEGRIQALKDKPGRGVKPKLSLECKEQVERIKQAFSLYPNNMHLALKYVNSSLTVPISRDTLRRFVKRLQAASG